MTSISDLTELNPEPVIVRMPPLGDISVGYTSSTLALHNSDFVCLPARSPQNLSNVIANEYASVRSKCTLKSQHLQLKPKPVIVRMPPPGTPPALSSCRAMIFNFSQSRYSRINAAEQPMLSEERSNILVNYSCPSLRRTPFSRNFL